MIASFDNLELDAFDRGRLSSDIYLVKRGVRPAANLMARRSMADEFVREIESAGLRCLVQPCGESHLSLTFFLHPHLEDLIPQIDALNRPLRDWAYGHLFGYSEVEIGQYIKEGIE